MRPNFEGGESPLPYFVERRTSGPNLGPMDPKNDARLRALEALEAGRQKAVREEEQNPQKTHKIRRGEIRPIADLTPEAREYFDAIADFLDAKGLLEVVDVLALTMLSKNLTLWISISNQIHGVDDVVQTFDNGSTNISGLQTAKDRIEASVLKLCGRLGLSPLDRAKLFGAATAASSANSKQSEGDDLDQFLA